jgi:hypothetical protein
MARIDDGHSTKITFELAPDIELWEKRVTPPGMDAGGPNDTTTMYNVYWRTRAPKKLVTLTDMTFVAAYDPTIYDSIQLILGVNQIITVTFPDNRQLSFYGWLDKFMPGEAREGDQPEATVTICPANQSISLVETDPVIV